MKSILVTGSAGFIASHLIEELLKDENNSIIGIDNFYSGTKENLDFIKSIDSKNRFEFIEADIRNFEEINKIIKDKEYNFSITAALCDECGEAMAVPGLIDKNIQEIDEQYRAYENLVSIDEIEKLMKIYKIGKAPLSLALGFGEVTITRYLSGQIPSKEYSDIIRAAIASPSYMKQKLLENKGKIAVEQLQLGTQRIK